MKLRPLIQIIACAALLVPLLSTRMAAAQEPDGARFRGAISAEGGALVLKGPGALGVGGVQAELGVQINNLVGVYAVPTMDIVFGKVGGVNLAAAALVDFTFSDMISVGAGPDVGAFAAIGGGNGSASAAGGALYGGRLHFAYYPIVSKGDDHIRRKAMQLGVDLRLLAGAAGSADVSSTSASASATNFVISPMVTFGYQAF